MEIDGAPGTYGLSLVVQTISVAEDESTAQSLLSIVTMGGSPNNKARLSLGSDCAKLVPVKVTYSPPRTEPKRGLIISIYGVAESA